MNKRSLSQPTKKTRIKVLPDTSTAPQVAAQFPVVGIGASAGGLEALEQFLRHVPENSGMAYVIIQHLDPTHKCLLPELLQHATKMNVMQATQRTKVQPDFVYVIPANKDISILKGELRLSKPQAPHGLRLPIDFFLQSLAKERKELAVAIILSGMGSDGSVGLHAIKDASGIVLVQDPTNAKFDSMPRNAIATGCADGVGPAEGLPAMISACLQHPPQPDASSDTGSRKQNALETITGLLRGRTGHDFSLYKKSTVSRRVERRMSIHQISRIEDYAQYLQDNPQEVELLFNELLIGVTNFFRDAVAWDYLRDQALPILLKDRPDNQVFRIWVAGCSSGEEAFSAAMIFREAMDKLEPVRHYRLQIFATDLDIEAIAKARQGLYPETITSDVSPDRLNRFFVKEDGKYRVCKEIRETIVFAQQDVVMDPPFTKLDLLICRNLLIYLEPQLQMKILPLFHYSLKPGGLLFLGSAETIGEFTNLFSSDTGKLKIYRRLSPVLRTEPLEFPPSFVPPLPDSYANPIRSTPAESLQKLADQVILRLHTPPAVLTTDKGDVVYISGRTGKYLEPAAGKANLNIFAMARDALRGELSLSFQKAVRESGVVKVRNLKMEDGEQGQTVEIVVQVLQEPAALKNMVLIAFKDMPYIPAPSQKAGKSSITPATLRVRELEGEILRLREELNTTHEEMQTSQEELRSANEELQSANEELQSTNEELTTSTEELQSMNEELQTVNAELQAKVDEFSRTASDMKNLLDSTDIATIFLDGKLLVRRFTARATKIIKFIPSDVGRPLTDLASELDYPALADDAREVLRTLVFSEKQIPAHDGRWFTVRIMPYRTIEDKIDGIVITLADITVHRQLLTASQARKEQHEDSGERKCGLV